MKKQLPTLSIKGDSIQQLIELEMILVMLGYDEPDEEWNNMASNIFSTAMHPFIYDTNSCKSITYSNHPGIQANDENSFHASDVMGIINYVENYKSILK